jgi:uncharacterized protein YndB with AHSA1/START domain
MPSIAAAISRSIARTASSSSSPPSGREEGEWTRVTIEIAEATDGCTLTLTHEMDPQWAAYEAQTRKGWTTILESLARILENEMADTLTADTITLRFERDLAAPIETVWQYLVDPELRARWFMGGPTELREGGKLGMTMRHDSLSDDPSRCPSAMPPNQGKAWSETITGSNRRGCSPSPGRAAMRAK